MSDSLNNLSSGSCQDLSSISPKELASRAADVAKATNIGQECKKAADSFISNIAGKMEVLKGLVGEAGVSSIIDSIKTDESGCSQIAVNLVNQAVTTITLNCQLKQTVNNVTINIKAGNTINIVPRDPLEFEIRKAAEIDAQIKQLYKDNNENISELIREGKWTKEIGDWYNKQTEIMAQTMLASKKEYLGGDTTIRNANIIQSIDTTLDAQIDIQNINVSEVKAQFDKLMKATAQNDLAQQLGSLAFSPSMRSMIDIMMKSTDMVSNEEISSMINSVSISSDGSNTITITGKNVLIENSTISQTIVADMVVKTLLGNAIQSGLDISNKIKADLFSGSNLSGQSKGLEDIIAAQGKANADAIKAVSSSGMVVIAIAILILFGLGYGGVKIVGTFGGAILNNMIFVVSIGLIVAGVMFFMKEPRNPKFTDRDGNYRGDASTIGLKIIGIILIGLGLAGIVFGVVLRSRMQSAIPIPIGI